MFFCLIATGYGLQASPGNSIRRIKRQCNQDCNDKKNNQHGNSLEWPDFAKSLPYVSHIYTSIWNHNPSIVYKTELQKTLAILRHHRYSQISWQKLSNPFSIESRQFIVLHCAHLKLATLPVVQYPLIELRVLGQMKRNSFLSSNSHIYLQILNFSRMKGTLRKFIYDCQLEAR